MKSFYLLFICLLCCGLSLSAQETYTVEGRSYTLKTEVSGPLTLLWNTIDGEYRYFSKKGSRIVELKNTRTDGRYQEEYKATLQSQTSDSPMDVSDVKLTRPSLKKFFVAYNKKVDPNYAFEEPSIALKMRLGAFAGGTNYVYFVNPDNTIIPQVGVEWELFDEVKLRRHALVVQFRQIFGASDYDFSSSQLSLNYRFKVIKTSGFDLFISNKFANFVYISQDIVTEDPAGMPLGIGDSGSEFQAPFAFGIGADIALGNGYLTFAYNDIVALNLDSSEEFPVDFTVGYKFNLQ